jgi:hypothetical protein
VGLEVFCSVRCMGPPGSGAVQGSSGADLTQGRCAKKGRRGANGQAQAAWWLCVAVGRGSNGDRRTWTIALGLNPIKYCYFLFIQRFSN